MNFYFNLYHEVTTIFNIMNTSISAKVFSWPLESLHPLPLTPPPDTHLPAFTKDQYAFPRILYKWNHMFCLHSLSIIILRFIHIVVHTHSSCFYC